jgi:muconolactone delta-isomerase
MKFLVLVKPGPAPPPIELVRSSQEWIDTRLSDGTIECCYGFPGGGGFSVTEADSHEELMDELISYPLSPFIEYEVRPLVALDAAFERFIAVAEQLSAQAS